MPEPSGCMSVCVCVCTAKDNEFAFLDLSCTGSLLLKLMSFVWVGFCVLFGVVNISPKTYPGVNLNVVAQSVRTYSGLQFTGSTETGRPG